MVFTEGGLSKLQAVLEGHVARSSVPGLVALVARGVETHVSSVGTMTLAGEVPVQRDTIFRIASMTKPITAVAALMLVEEGKLTLDEPIHRLAPELANRRVLKRIDGPLDDTEPAKRAITVEDLLTYRLGWGVLFSDTYPIAKAVAGLPGFSMPNPKSAITPDQFMQRLGCLPLMAQPGERWLYSAGSNILGVLVSRATGKPLDRVLSERIFAPLGMTDTAFDVPREKLHRFITGYVPRDGKLTLFDPPEGMYVGAPAFPAGDGGLVSTADDFLAFARFMMSGLAPDGRRLLSTESLRAMTTNHLTAGQRAGGREILGPVRGWGYGVGVMAEASPHGIARGAYGWDGGFGTSWFNDPPNSLTAILLTQRFFESPDPPQIHKDFWQAAYTA